MTTYILHGGFTKGGAQKDDAFFDDVLRAAPQGNVKILLCYFAKEKDRWEKNISEDVESFSSNKLSGQDLEFQTADFVNFYEQLRWADIVVGRQ